MSTAAAQSSCRLRVELQDQGMMEAGAVKTEQRTDNSRGGDISGPCGAEAPGTVGGSLLVQTHTPGFCCHRSVRSSRVVQERELHPFLWCAQ